jgi:filamentous hemagglutinin
MPDGNREVPPKIDPAKQGKHIFGHRNYIPGRSTMTDPDPQVLLDQWAGKGDPVNDVPIGEPGSKARVAFGKIIGDHVDPVTGEAKPTTKGIIVYDRRGSAHIIPARPGKESPDE